MDIAIDTSKLAFNNPEKEKMKEGSFEIVEEGCWFLKQEHKKYATKPANKDIEWVRGKCMPEGCGRLCFLTCR